MSSSNNNCRSYLVSGFTYVELLVVGGVMATLLGLGLASLSRLQSQTSAGIIADQIAADMRTQQMAAMNLYRTEGSVNSGVIFDQNSYTLFNGESFDPDDSGNFTVTLEPPWQISTNALNNSVIYESESGEVVGLSSGQWFVAVGRADSAEQNTFYINRFGTIQ